MSNEVRYTPERGRKLTADEIAMIEAARKLPVEYDEENPPIDPETTPELYAAMMQAVAERNRRVVGRLRELK